MPNFNINKQHHLEDAYRGATWNSWCLGFDRSHTRLCEEKQHREMIVVLVDSEGFSPSNW